MKKECYRIIKDDRDDNGSTVVYDSTLDYENNSYIFFI